MGCLVDLGATSYHVSHFDAYSYKCGEKPQSVHSENYKCLSCFEEKPIPIKKGHKKDFEICTNRETIKKGYDWSILKKCPKERNKTVFICEKATFYRCKIKTFMIK